MVGVASSPAPSLLRHAGRSALAARHQLLVVAPRLDSLRGPRRYAVGRHPRLVGLSGAALAGSSALGAGSAPGRRVLADRLCHRRFGRRLELRWSGASSSAPCWSITRPSRSTRSATCSASAATPRTTTAATTSSWRCITLGEGWHNNHHHYQSSANQGFFWWEIDISYYVIRTMSLARSGLGHSQARLEGVDVPQRGNHAAAKLTGIRAAHAALRSERSVQPLTPLRCVRGSEGKCYIVGRGGCGRGRLRGRGTRRRLGCGDRRFRRRIAGMRSSRHRRQHVRIGIVAWSRI